MKGVSSVIATLLIVAITVSISASLYGYATGIFTGTTSGGVTIVDASCGSVNYVAVRTSDPASNVSVSNLLVKFDDADINVDGVQNKWDDTTMVTNGGRIYGNNVATLTINNLPPGVDVSKEVHRIKLISQSSTQQVPVSCIGAITTSQSPPPPPPPPLVGDTTPPTVSLTSPTDGSSVSGTITVTATANDNVGVVGIQFKLDGNNLGAEDTNGGDGWSISWNTTTVANGTHSLTATARDEAGNSQTSSQVTVTVNNLPLPGDTTPPTVSITNPVNGSTVSGVISINAAASDNVGVVGVQFRLDGSNLGAEDTTSPYDISWNTSTTNNGLHNLTAVARDAAGNSQTSVPVTLRVNNTPPVIFQDNFNGGVIDSSKWSIVGLGSLSANCGYVSSPTALYFNGAGSPPSRNATTVDLNVLTANTIGFYLRIGNATAPCENANLGENVALDYSTNGGANWIRIKTYNESLYPSFTLVPEQIPNAAKTASTRFRWWQLAFSNGNFDNWAIDDVVIS